MHAKPLNDADHADWDAFCRESDDAWFMHTTDRIEYILSADPDDSALSHSFAIINNGQIIAVCPLVVDTVDGATEITYGGGPVPAPAFSNDFSWKQRKRVMKMLFSEIDNIAEREGVTRARFSISPLSPRYLDGDVTYNYFLRFGYSDISTNTRIIDLRKPLEDLRSEMRKGHDHAIRNAAETLDGMIYDADTISRDVFDEYKRCHSRDAGGQTRPDKTFELMFEWIRDGNAFLVEALADGTSLGFSYFYAFKRCAYYGSSARDPDSDLYDLPIGHYIQWMALQWMVEQGMDFYEIGRQQFSQVPPHLASEKEINISYFKRGFGGETVTHFMAEKFYEGDRYREVGLERTERYAQYLASDGDDS